MEAYKKQSSRAWANSADREFNKHVENSGLLAEYINGRQVIADKFIPEDITFQSKSVLAVRKVKGFVINETMSAKIVGVSRKRAIKILTVMCAHGLILKKSFPSTPHKLHFCRKNGVTVNPSDIEEASTY